MDISQMKKVGTREEVFKGLAARTAGGLKRDDIIEKQFGTRTLYISKRLSDKMRENFKFIRTNNPNYFKRQPKRTMISTAANTTYPQQTSQSQLQQTSQPQILSQSQPSQPQISSQQQRSQPARRIGGKTHKLAFKVRENTVKNVYYPELQGMNIQELKEELAREEAEEDRGQLKPLAGTFTIQDMPDIDISNLG